MRVSLLGNRSISFRGLTATGVSISGDSRYALVNESPGVSRVLTLEVNGELTWDFV